MKSFINTLYYKYHSKSKKMMDFINKLKTYEDMFMYNFSLLDTVECKQKIYLFSPDQNHSYISVDKVKNKDNTYTCEVGSLYLTNNSTFEDTPNSVYEISDDVKKEFDTIYKKKKKWTNKHAQMIKNNFSDKNLII